VIQSVINVFKIPELRKKILFTLLMLVVYRAGMFTPIPGTDTRFLSDMAAPQETSSSTGGGVSAKDYLDFVAQITGGRFGPFLFSLGIMPYISASIILQLLTQAVPSIQKLAKEGETGRRKINEYTRYLTVLLCIIQAFFIINSAAYSGHSQGGWRMASVSPGIYRLVAITATTAGTVFLMWLGELVDEFGIGNGISLIIMAGIVDRLPSLIYDLVVRSATLQFSGFVSVGGKMGIETLVIIIAMFIAIVFGVVMITQAQRRIPIQQAKHTRGRRVYGGQRQYLPLRVNQGGVIPVIFASSLLYLPMYVFQAFGDWARGGWPNSWFAAFAGEIANFFSYGNVIYELSYVALIFLFCYFWTAIQFQPKEMAENLRDWGSFIPGMRPGRRTAEYLERVMNRITYIGSYFLAIVAIIPSVVHQVTGATATLTGFLGGTSLLIIVSVALDLVQRIESHLIMRHYEGFLAEGRVRGRMG